MQRGAVKRGQYRSPPSKKDFQLRTEDTSNFPEERSTAEQTDLSTREAPSGQFRVVIEIAKAPHAVSFESVSKFNDSMAEVFSKRPELRHMELPVRLVILESLRNHNIMFRELYEETIGLYT